MGSEYKPRKGDIVKVELAIAETFDGLHYLRDVGHGTISLKELTAAGKVELVSRAEPDWQPGEFARHVETGQVFRYLPDLYRNALKWRSCEGEPGQRIWYRDNELTGKLRRMRLVPEDEA